MENDHSKFTLPGSTVLIAINDWAPETINKTQSSTESKKNTVELVEVNRVCRNKQNETNYSNIKEEIKKETQPIYENNPLCQIASKSCHQNEKNATSVEMNECNQPIYAIVNKSKKLKKHIVSSEDLLQKEYLVNITSKKTEQLNNLLKNYNKTKCKETLDTFRDMAENENDENAPNINYSSVNICPNSITSDPRVGVNAEHSIYAKVWKGPRKTSESKMYALILAA